MMLIKEIKEDITDSMRELIRDYLNYGYKKQEIANIFDLKQCENSHCDNWELEEDLSSDINDNFVCESCR